MSDTFAPQHLLAAGGTRSALIVELTLGSRTSRKSRPGAG
jgi:hypothetical protein